MHSLARHRAEIEAEIGRVGELSLRAARRLIAEPAKKESKPKPDLMVAWSKAMDAFSARRRVNRT